MKNVGLAQPQLFVLIWVHYSSSMIARMWKLSFIISFTWFPSALACDSQIGSLSDSSNNIGLKKGGHYWVQFVLSLFSVEGILALLAPVSACATVFSLSLGSRFVTLTTCQIQLDNQMALSGMFMLYLQSKAKSFRQQLQVFILDPLIIKRPFRTDVSALLFMSIFMNENLIWFLLTDYVKNIHRKWDEK